MALLPANGLVWRSAPDRATRLVAIAVLRALDEDAATPVELAALPIASDPRAVVMLRAGGLVVLAGDPDAPPADLELRLDEPGFRPARIAIVLPVGAARPAMLPDLVLRRMPRDLDGRVVAATTGDPLPAASVTLAPAPPAPAGTPLLLLPALAADVPAGTTLRGFPLVPVGGAVPVKRLLQDAPAGTTWLELDDRQDLAPGQVLRLGPPERRGFARLSFVAPAPLAGPGIVLLAAPLAATARQDDAAQPCVLGVPAAAAATTLGDAFAGEGLLLATAPTPGEVVEIGPPGAGALHAPPGPTDADGRYRFAGLARIPRFAATAAAAGFAQQTRFVSPAAGTARVDWRLVP